MALPDGAFGEVPFFQFVNTYNQGRPESVEIVERIRALLDSYPERTSLAEVSCAEDAIADAAAYVDAPDKLHMAYNSSLMSEEPLIAPGSRASSSGCRPNSRAESFAGPPEPTTFPASPPAGTGL